MSEPTKPALTAEEWGTPSPVERFYGGWNGEVLCDNLVAADLGERPHALAALALYGQPFGFTREDVELLRNIVRFNPDEPRRIHGLADRIEALLPPEGS